MSFNLDDPLAGILSDGSDDSFFDDDVLGKKKTTKKKGTPTVEKKSSLFDLENREQKKDSLFDLEDSSSKKILEESKSTPKIDKPKSPVPVFQRTISKESIKIQNADSKNKSTFDAGKSPSKSKISSSADKLELAGGIKKEAVKPLEKGKSSQSLLDDILGGPSTKSGSSNQVKSTNVTKNQNFDLDSILGKSDSKQVLNTSKNVTQKSAKADNSNKNMIQEKKNKPSDNWLGIFQDKDINDDDEVATDMPAWLMGSDSKKKKADEVEKKQATKQVVTEVTKEEPVIDDHKEKQKEVHLESDLEQLTKNVSTSRLLQGSNEDITTEGAALYLQQQESQLMVALQLKAQEEKLAAMQMRQKETQRVQREAALAHHAQLDAMLRRQADHRQQMQAIITGHQERITQRIKALLGSSNIENEDNSQDVEFEKIPTEQKESPYMREKKQLLQLVQSLQENHDKEIDLMETSYRRQLAFLEVSLNQAEERMKEESEKLIKFYTEKINWLEEHHHLYKKLTDENLNSLTERHKAENEMLREQHLDNVKVLQEHHATLIENIKKAVKQEQVLIQDSAGFSSDLRELVADVKDNKSQCQRLMEGVQSLTENMQRETDRSLQARETQINDMIEQLKKERENFESEKSENRDMVKMLETRLKQMTTMIEEETASLKQKKMEFEFEKATFNKQTEFAKNVLKRQDEEIKMLKEDIQKEYQDKIANIDEEKMKAQKDSAAVAKEKMSINSIKQDLEKMKAELQAQLEEMNEERSKLNIEKQQMHMEEQRILAKSRDLDMLAKTAIEKQSQADKKYSEAEFLQRKYDERIRRVQEHVVSLNAREKQIAREKVALSRERLTLHNERKEIESRQQCSLCKSSHNIPQYNIEPSYTLSENLINIPVSRDFGGGNVNSAMNAIEQEMAKLMGRSLGLRHTAEVKNINYNEGQMSDRRDIAENLPAAKVELGSFKDYMDPKFMMLRLDVQQVLSNLDQSKKNDIERDETGNEDV